MRFGDAQNHKGKIEEDDPCSDSAILRQGLALLEEIENLPLIVSLSTKDSYLGIENSLKAQSHVTVNKPAISRIYIYIVADM